MLFLFRWIVAILNADNSPSQASFVRSDFSQLNTASFFTRLERCRRRNSMRYLGKCVLFSDRLDLILSAREDRRTGAARFGLDRTLPSIPFRRGSNERGCIHGG